VPSGPSPGVSKSLVLETVLVGGFPNSEYCFAGFAAAQHLVLDQPLDRKLVLRIVEGLPVHKVTGDGDTKSQDGECAILSFSQKNPRK